MQNTDTAAAQMLDAGMSLGFDSIDVVEALDPHGLPGFPHSLYFSDCYHSSPQRANLRWPCFSGRPQQSSPADYGGNGTLAKAVVGLRVGVDQMPVASADGGGWIEECPL